MKNLNQFLYNNAFKIIIVFLFLQPLIDVLTAVSLNLLNSSFTIGLVTRFLFLIFMIYYCVILSKDNKLKIIYLILIFTYIVLFSINTLYLKGISVLGYELKNTLKAFYFPILLITLLSFFKDNKNNITLESISKLFIVYSLFVLIPNFFGIGFQSYAVTKSGNIGLFYTANEIGAILSILMISYINLLFTKKRYIQLILSIFLILYMLTSIGTKGPLILFFILTFYYLIKYLKSLIILKKYKLFTVILAIFICSITLFCFLAPKTNFYKNIKVHLEFLEVHNIKDIVTNKKVLDHFVFSERLSFWSKTNKIYKDSNLSEKILGIGYVSNYSTDYINMKMIEMDFVDIFYRHGIIGFLLYFSSCIIIFYQVIRELIRKKEKNNIVEVSMISIIFSIFLALLTGHVLISPSVSIYVALIISLLYNEINMRGKQYD